MTAYPGMGGGKSPDTSIRIRVTPTVPGPAERLRRAQKKVRKLRSKNPVMSGSPAKSGNSPSPGVPGPGAAGGWRTA